MKIIATDYDGTVTHRGVTPELLSAIAEWRAKGNLFGIVTGRPRTSIHQTLLGPKLTVDFEVADNGAVIYNGKGECLKYSAISPEDAVMCINTARELDHTGFRISSCDCYIMMDQAPKAELLPGTGIIRIGNAYIEKPTEFFTRSTSPELCQTAKDLILEKSEGRIRGLSSSRITNDFVRADVSKAHGILDLAKLYNIEPEGVYTIGDAFNDLEMLLYPGFTGYAVENAMPEVKEKVGRIVDSPLELLKILL